MSGPRKGVNYFSQCLTNYNHKLVDRLLPKHRYLLGKEWEPKQIHSNDRHFAWMQLYHKGGKAYDAENYKELEWYDGMNMSISNDDDCIENLPHDPSLPANDTDDSSTADDAVFSKEILVDTFSTADDAELSVKSVPEVNFVRVIFGKETLMIEKCILLSKEVITRIDDPHDSVYIVESDDDGDETFIPEKSYYKSNMQRIKETNSSDDNDMVERSD